MAAVLGLLAALTYGVSDLLAGLAARRSHFLWVGVGVQLIGTALTFAVAPALTDRGLSSAQLGPSLLWGALSGVGTTVGILALYRGFGHGEIAVVGPLSAVGAAAVPGLIGALLGERLSPVSLVGVLIALPAIWLVARQPGDPAQRGSSRIRQGVLDGALSGLGFGLLFVALAQADPRSGLWPIASGQLVSTLLAAGCVSVGLFARPARPGFTRRTVLLMAGTAVLGVTANGCYLYATRHGSTTVSAVLTSLYPAVTVLLAIGLLKERPSRSQVVGLLLVAVAVVAIVLG